ncbi:MAG: hypothetical protein NC453_20155 [Muribaculum sp.]|nr:hypothetical protein [Muribaculum sp.]
MTKKFKEIIKRLEALVTFKADMFMTDDDFILNIEAINLLINVHDDLGLDSKRLRKRMSNLYPEFSRRIYGKKNIQYALPLIKALNDFIYGRGDDRGSQRWGDTLVEMCCKVVYEYRKEALIFSTDYLFALDIVSCKNDDDDNPNIKEYKDIVSTYLLDIDNVSLSEKIRRVGAYERAKHLFISDEWEKWVEVREQLKMADVRSMDDETFLQWCDVTDQYPKNELKKRSCASKQMMLEYLRAQVISEFAKQDRLRTQRKLAKGLKSLNDNIIGDIIPLKIDSEMSVSTLYAFETIFYLRLAMAQISDEDNSSTYELLCRDRFEKIANALKKKYLKAANLNEKIEILERLSVIGGEIHSHHEDFAIEEADKLKDLPDLTYSQKLRLDWIPSITSGNESEIVAKLLPEANTSFEIATLSLISDFVTNKEREAIHNRYFELFDTALSTNNTTELGNLLTLSAYWNSNPSLRPRLTESATKAATIEALSLPERRVNDIVAAVYTQIDKITGKYNTISA